MTAFRTGACVLGRIRAFVAGGQADRAGVVLSHNQEHSKNLPRDTRENKDNNKRNYTITASKSIRPDQAATVRDKGLKGTQDTRKSVRLEQNHAADRTAARGAVLELIDYSCQGPKGAVVRGIHVCPSRFRICAPARLPARQQAAGWHGRQTGRHSSQYQIPLGTHPNEEANVVFHGAEWTAEPIPWEHSSAWCLHVHQERRADPGCTGPDPDRRRRRVLGISGGPRFKLPPPP